jgi:hypothetical protein
MSGAPRLAIELVPRSSWGHNVRSVVATETWDALRWYLGAARSRPRFCSIDFPGRPFRARLTCTCCGTEQPTLELHEEWHYDDKKQVQRLVGLKPICLKCHIAKHLDCKEVVDPDDEAHIAAVNGWTPQRTKQYIKRAFELWKSRSGVSYLLDVASHLACYKIPATMIHMEWLGNPRRWIGSRLDAILWAGRLVDSDAIILDTETTGLLDYAKVEVIELAAIDMRGKVVYHSLFKPRYGIPAGAIEIHGITNEQVKSSPTFGEQVKGITAALEGKTIVTYNAKFDREVIWRTFMRYKAQCVSARWECAMQAYRTFMDSGRFLPLRSGSHRALADCRATLKLMRGMAPKKIKL